MSQRIFKRKNLDYVGSVIVDVNRVEGLTGNELVGQQWDYGRENGELEDGVKVMSPQEIFDIKQTDAIALIPGWPQQNAISGLLRKEDFTSR